MNDTSKQTITLKSRILRLLLEQCLLQETIEAQVNKQGWFFNTRIIDHFPTVESVVDEKDQSTVIKPYDPFTYLKKEQCLLLEPLVSDQSTAQVNKGDHLFIRFFTGHYAYEAYVPFEQIIEMKGKPMAVQVGFPDKLGVAHVRKNIRVSALMESKIMLKVKAENVNEFDSRIMELSSSGLSFCLPHKYTELLPVDSKVSLNISVFGEDELCLDVCVRHYNKLSNKEKDCCSFLDECFEKFGHHKDLCGVDFLGLDQSGVMRVNDLIFFVQREYIISEKEGLIKFNQDLEKQVENKTGQLRERDIQLLEMDRMAGIATLAAGIAHEINNPLSFVKSSIGFVKKGLSKMSGALKFWDDKPVPEQVMKEYKEYLSQINFDYLVNSMEDKFERIKKGIERIMEIVKDLRSFSMVDRKDLGHVDINQSIEEAIKVSASEGLENVEFVKELGETPLMECSANDMNQCLLHVIKNAVDAVENNGIIRISSSFNKKEDQIIIKIVDNGKGMSSEVLRQAFNPFFTTKKVGSGTGVGLSIIERIIKRHGGHINLTSKEDFGTTVTITLPKKSEMVKSN